MPLKFNNHAEVCTNMENFIKDNVKSFEKDGAIVSISGGLDSSVILKACANALGPEKVLALFMFDKDTNDDNRKDAAELARELGVRFKEINITQQLTSFPAYRQSTRFTMRPGLLQRGYEFWMRRRGIDIKGSHNKFLRMADSFYRVKNRVRMVNLYYHAEVENLLVIGNTTKTEQTIGLYVKHGLNECADIMPISNLYKTHVREVAKYMKLPDKIINRDVAPEQIPGLNNEVSIGLNYEQIDSILFFLSKMKKPAEIAKECNIDQAKVEFIISMTDKLSQQSKPPKVG